MRVLCLEMSTSSAKALLFDSKKGVVKTTSEGYESADRGGMQRTDVVFDLVMKIGRKVAAGEKIEAIAICSTWHSVVLLDQSLKPASPTYMWTYTEPSEICRSIRADKDLATTFYTRTGCVPHVSYGIYDLLYLREQGVDLSDKKISSQGGYAFYRLTGEFAETANVLSGMGVISLATGELDDFVLDFVKINRNQFGRMVTYHDTAPILPEMARRLGVAEGVPVVPAYSDGALNQIGSNAIRPDIMTLSVGTSGAVRLVSDEARVSKTQGHWCYRGVDRWMVGAATAGAGNCISWLKKRALFNRWDYKFLDRNMLVQENTPVFLPFLTGERCPGWNDQRSGGFYELKPSMDIRDLYRAVGEGVLFNLFQCYCELTSIAPPPRRIIVSGGILNSKNWCQMLADIFQQEIALSETQHASSLGGVALALRVAGGLDRLEDFTFDQQTPMHPRPEAKDYYRKQYSRYLDYYSLTDR